MVNPAHENTQYPEFECPDNISETVRFIEDFGVLFEGAVIISYTRADALADGSLIDVSDMARDAGFLLPVAVSANLWADLEDIPDRSSQDVTGRLSDLLSVARFSIAQAVAAGQGESAELLFHFSLFRLGFPDCYTVKSMLGLDDDGKPCLTFLQSSED